MYAHFQDLVDGYVGPFSTREDVAAHVEFCKARGDGAVFKGTVDQPPADALLVLTPAEDRAFQLPISPIRR